jgi:hypothetical protein
MFLKVASKPETVEAECINEGLPSARTMKFGTAPKM